MPFFGHFYRRFLTNTIDFQKFRYIFDIFDYFGSFGKNFAKAESERKKDDSVLDNFQPSTMSNFRLLTFAKCRDFSANAWA